MTQLFANGFESGDFSSWTGNYTQNGTSQVQSSLVNSGSYAGQFTVTLSGGYADAYKNLSSSYTTVNQRFYVRFNTLPASGEGVLLGFLANNSNNNAILGIGLRYSGGSAKWFVGYLKAGSYTLLYSSANTPQTNTWYCLEVKAVINSSSGTVEAWINGTKDNSLCDTSGFNNTAWGNINRAFVGQDSQTESTYPSTTYVDDVVVDESYIGTLGGAASKLMYTAGASQSVTAGSISSVITVQVQDSNGNPVTTGATVNLSTTSSGLFYSDSGGNTQITSIVISSGQSSGNCYYKDTTAGTPTLTASSTGLTSATTQFTINSSGSQYISSIAQGAPFTVASGALSLNVSSPLQVSNSSLGINASASPTFAGLTVNGNIGVTNLNVASGLTLNGGAGNSGQVLASNGSGNAPTWQTVSGGSGGLTTVTPSNLSGSGAIISGWTIPWAQVTSAPSFLTSVTPSNLSGSGAIASGWTVPWSQVTNAPSFVTSGSTVTFSGLTVSGALSVSLGLVSVSGAFSASGAMSAVINSLDDGSGNATFHKITAYNLIESKENFFIPSSYNAWLSYMANDSATFPETNGKITFSDVTEGLGQFSGNYTDLIGGLWIHDPDNGYDFPATAPFIMTRHHFIVKKDAYIKGQIGSVEGGIILHAGSLAPGWYSGKGTNNPMIQLAQADSEGNNSTLEIRTRVGGTWGYGNLACQDLTVNGKLTGNLHSTNSGSGGTYIDVWGNMHFNGGSTSNSWSVINSWGNQVFTVPNQTGGTAGALIDCNLIPRPSGTNYGLGSGSNRWAGIVVHDIYYGNSYSGYDAIDDLAYVKQIQTINITENGKTRQIIDPKTLKLFNAEVDETNPIRNDPRIADCTDMSKVVGFMLCCHKAAAQKLDEYDANFAEVVKLKDEIADLRTQLQALETKIAA